MRYLVKARVKPGHEKPLRQAIADGSLGHGSIAGDEYIYDLDQARVGEDGVAHWVETCFCASPLAEEQPYWKKYFELSSVKDAHNRRNCRHENGTELWVCGYCDSRSGWRRNCVSKANHSWKRCRHSNDDTGSQPARKKGCNSNEPDRSSALRKNCLASGAKSALNSSVNHER